MFEFSLIDTAPLGTRSRRLERQRAQVIDRSEKRFERLQGVEIKNAAADVTFAEQLDTAGDPRPRAATRSRRSDDSHVADGSLCVYTVSSPLFDAPRWARRPEPVLFTAGSRSGLRPGGFISVTTGRARRRRRG
jgi:hypothetical protein